MFIKYTLHINIKKIEMIVPEPLKIFIKLKQTKNSYFY